jgi:hypothetical protein
MGSRVRTVTTDMVVKEVKAVRLVKAARPFHVAIKVSALTKIIFFQKGAAHASETSLCIYSSRLFGINIVCTCGLIVQMVINATQR